MTNWKQAQKWEKEWWGDCVNTFDEERKQLVYADRMGLKQEKFKFDMEGKKVLDIGSGPVSLLLKCENVDGVAIDPLTFPDWVDERYEEAGILFEQMKGEELIDEDCYDEVWIYNVLQHVEDPKKVIENAKRAGDLIRIFEWIERGVCDGHLHTLREDKLNEWLGGAGKVERLDGYGCVGLAYYGIFPT